jgi:holo-ACP synthase CitX
MDTLTSVRLALLAARDARAEVIARLSAALPGGHSLVFLSLNVPGPDKSSPRLTRLAHRARRAMLASLTGADLARDGHDALGPWAAVACAGDAAETKRRAVALEETRPAGRLLDLDVVTSSGAAIGRAALGLPPRSCLVCREPAVDCIRAGRHTARELDAAVLGLLDRDDATHVAAALVDAARAELELTPKPGLVDRRDNGSHPDLSFEQMERSVAFLPRYYEELLAAPDLPACIGAGVRAERRMLAAIGTNTHRGYIFLSGLVLLSVCVAGRGALSPDDPLADAPLRARIAELARAILARPGSPGVSSHGAAVRAALGMGGIHTEALAGLPSVFDHGLPALDQARRRFGPGDSALHYLMAVLMTTVEDTTAVHRCGHDGLARLRADGARLKEAMEADEPYLPLLAVLNADYRSMNLTMGGVADCMAITIAVERARSLG